MTLHVLLLSMPSPSTFKTVSQFATLDPSTHVCYVLWLALTHAWQGEAGLAGLKEGTAAAVCSATCEDTLKQSAAVVCIATWKKTFAR
jgi:hypothetical protein